jgi:hypothetical protein
MTSSLRSELACSIFIFDTFLSCACKLIFFLGQEHFVNAVYFYSMNTFFHFIQRMQILWNYVFLAFTYYENDCSNLK